MRWKQFHTKTSLILVLFHPRARVANQLAVDGQDWAKLFSQFHSGTYVNQWMVLNYDRFSQGQVPEEGFLTVLEEIPGLIHYEDMTSHLIVRS